MTSGSVYLVGAGPGDPGLFTLRGAEVLGRADVVLFDALAAEHLLDLAPPAAERIYVGKRGPTPDAPDPSTPHEEERPWSGRSVPQSETTALLVDLARAGRTVVRLKGGDPYVFARGGEEADALADAGIPFEVVPGVTSAIAAPAYAGIAVTHRDAASTLAVVTGHEDPAKAGAAVDFPALARMGTVVFLMGMTHLRENLRRLAEAGRDPATPAAAVEWGTLPRQRVVRATLGDLADRVAAAGVGPPAVVVVGEVCLRGEALDWFGRRPLRGRRVVVTRERRRARDLCRRLEEAGAEAIEFPVIETRPLPPEPVLAALRRGGWDWIVFTSRTGVDAVADALEAAGLDARALSGGAAPPRLAAIGPATAEALLDRWRLRADAVPLTFLSDAIPKALGEVRGRRILLLRARGARRILPEALSAAGAIVEEVDVYATHPVAGDSAALRRRVEAGEVDAVLLTSPSTVEGLVAALPEAVGLLRRRALLASIGPVTSEAIRRAGLEVGLEAQRHDAAGLVEALVDRFARLP